MSANSHVIGLPGEFQFSWKTVEATGEISGYHQQSIYGESPMDAMNNFVSMHGELSPDEFGCCLIITNISWSPAK